MKTKTTNQKSNLTEGILVMLFVMMCSSGKVSAQERDSTQALFGSDIKVSEIWSPEVKFNSIQGDLGTLIGFYGGAAFNRSFLLGISGGANLGHPHVNYGYFGALGQYIHNPANLWHFSLQILVAYGSTKDYQNPKSGLFDNFWNISGARFYLMEPGVNLELNLSKNLTLVMGLSYRYVTGLNNNNENVQITHVTNADLSGLNINFSLKFIKDKKPKVY